METANLENIKKELSESVNNKAIQLVYNNTNLPNKTIGTNLQTILEKGVKDFEQKTGRQMTYSEMREMWG